jgi:hypothetical protein
MPAFQANVGKRVPNVTHRHSWRNISGSRMFHGAQNIMYSTDTFYRLWVTFPQ